MSPKQLLWLFVLSWRMWAQSTPIKPVGIFDLQLEERAGHRASILSFVARNSHLYLAISSPNGFLELQTTLEGIVQRTATLGAEQVSGFDVDQEGNCYVLHGGTRLTEFDSEGRFKRTRDLQSPIVSFAVVSGRPLGARPDGHVRFLDLPDRDLPDGDLQTGDARTGGFTLAAYPPPWLFFGIEPDRLGILRPQSPSLHIFQMKDRDVSDVSIVWPGEIVSSRNLIAAAADPEGRIYLLGSRDSAGSSSVIRCDDRATPKSIFHYALPAAFQPRMIGIAGEHVYLADPTGKVAFYPRNPETTAAEALDQFPELLTDLEPLRNAARKAGYTGRVLVRISVSAEGFPEHARIKSPAFLGNITEVMEALRALRFGPAVRAGKNASVPLQLNVDVY